METKCELIYESRWYLTLSICGLFTKIFIGMSHYRVDYANHVSGMNAMGYEPYQPFEHMLQLKIKGEIRMKTCKKNFRSTVSKR